MVLARSAQSSRVTVLRLKPKAMVSKIGKLRLELIHPLIRFQPNYRASGQRGVSKAPHIMSPSPALRLVLAVFVLTSCARKAQGFLGASSPPTCRKTSLKEGHGTPRGQVYSKRRISMNPCQLADTSAEYVKRELERVQTEYEAKRRAKILEQTRRSTASGESSVIPLANLEFLPYIDENGGITKLEVGEGVKASVYAIYDEAKVMQFIGVSRGVQNSLRLHLARCPDKTYFLKVQHITQPSRSLLEVIKDSWIKENGGKVPPGNDNGEGQASWESAMNVVPLMTDADKERVESYRCKGREHLGLKEVARRFQHEKEEILNKRGVTESLRFDPRLKSKGLLDIETGSKGPDMAVPLRGKPNKDK
ncbi:unnamed protein product [Discosporangium mesarthrocarpum]